MGHRFLSCPPPGYCAPTVYLTPAQLPPFISPGPHQTPQAEYDTFPFSRRDTVASTGLRAQESWVPEHEATSLLPAVLLSALPEGPPALPSAHVSTSVLPVGPPHPHSTPSDHLPDVSFCPEPGNHSASLGAWETESGRLPTSPSRAKLTRGHPTIPPSKSATVSTQCLGILPKAPLPMTDTNQAHNTRKANDSIMCMRVLRLHCELLEDVDMPCFLPHSLAHRDTHLLHEGVPD